MRAIQNILQEGFHFINIDTTNEIISKVRAFHSPTSVLCSEFLLSPNIKEKGKEKNNLKEPKQSRSVWIYTRAAHMDICDKRLLESESRNNIYKQVWTLPTWLLWGSVRCGLRVWRVGGLSQVVREKSKGKGWGGWVGGGETGEVEREPSLHHPSWDSSACCFGK